MLTLQLTKPHGNILFSMQQCNRDDLSRLSEVGSRAAAKSSQGVPLNIPGTFPPSISELRGLEKSLSPCLERGLRASWASLASEAEPTGGERIDVNYEANSVMVSVQIPFRRSTTSYYNVRDNNGNVMTVPYTQWTQVIVSGQAHSRFNPQTGVWTAQEPSTLR